MCPQKLFMNRLAFIAYAAAEKRAARRPPLVSWCAVGSLFSLFHRFDAVGFGQFLVILIQGEAT